MKRNRRNRERRPHHCARSYHFVVAVWRAKEADSKYDHSPVALRIELVHKVDDHLYPRVILLTVSLLTAICLFPYH